MRLILRILFFLLAMLALAPACRADTDREDAAVDIGIYINHINSLSYKQGTFTVDMTLWFRWKNPSLHPDKTFAIKGATILARRDEYSGSMSGSDAQWAGVDVVATLDQQFDVRHFPFDEQKLLIQIEEIEQDGNTLSYRLDTDNIRLNRSLAINGWKIRSDHASVARHAYETSFGYTGNTGQQKFIASRMNYELNIARVSPLSGIRLIFAPIVAIFILFFTSLLPTTQSARFSVGTTAIFALVSSHYLILSQLPETAYITLAESIVIFGLLQSLVYFMVTVYSSNAHARGKLDLHQKLDRFLAMALGMSNVLFAGFIAWLI
ncbi:MAG: hypothetical protein RIQ52_1407 [Pseudomonadota bacterium]